MPTARLTEIMESVKTTVEALGVDAGTTDTSAATTAGVLEDAQEALTNGIKTIATDHALIHAGQLFLSSYYDALTTGEVVVLAFATAAGKYTHFKDISMTSLGGQVKVEILKDPAVTVNTGTAIPSQNANHNSTVVATSTIRPAPTFTGGTLWDQAYCLASASNQSRGIANFIQNPNQELVMKPSEFYLIRITNLETATIPFFMKFSWYEETQGLAV